MDRVWVRNYLFIYYDVLAVGIPIEAHAHYLVLPCRMLLAVIHYGDGMRAWLDVGYSTAENN